jgi:hypothetical protein
MPVSVPPSQDLERRHRAPGGYRRLTDISGVCTVHELATRDATAASLAAVAASALTTAVLAAAASHAAASRAALAAVSAFPATGCHLPARVRHGRLQREQLLQR